jgi:D-alanyl-D-alanine carboxypeptidase (penicillin-binding protein 5/6)
MLKKQIHNLAPVIFAILVLFSFRGGYSQKQAIKAEPKVLGQTVTGPLRGTETTLPLTVLYPKQVKQWSQKSISANNFLVYDKDTGQILMEKNSTLSVPIASLTKLMTALVTYKAGLLDQSVTITEKDYVSETPVLQLKFGDTVRVSDLFNAMLIGSANDAALALSHAVEKKSGELFETTMNRTALELGMTQSSFSNPLGFDSRTNYSSAQDLVKLINELDKYSAFSLVGKATQYSFKSQTGNTYKIRATNKLASTDSEIYAVKTGFTGGAQGTMITQAQRDNHKIIIIILGSNNREGDTIKLKEAAFENFIWE